MASRLWSRGLQAARGLARRPALPTRRSAFQESGAASDGTNRWLIVAAVGASAFAAYSVSGGLEGRVSADLWRVLYRCTAATEHPSRLQS